MERQQAIDLLLQDHPQELVDDYVAQAEERMGPAYWAAVDSEQALRRDFALFVEATEVTNNA